MIQNSCTFTQIDREMIQKMHFFKMSLAKQVEVFLANSLV